MKSLLPQKKISSAGLITANSGLEGQPASQPAQRVAQIFGFDLSQHKARQVTVDIIKNTDLILVMETKHKKSLQKIAPEVTGKTLLISHWNGQQDVCDPYQRKDEFYKETFSKIQESLKAWVKKLS